MSAHMQSKVHVRIALFEESGVDSVGSRVLASDDVVYYEAAN